MKGFGAQVEELKARKLEQGATDFQAKIGIFPIDFDPKDTGFITGFVDKKVLKGESASVNTITNARSLGKLAAFMANKGTLNGKQLMSRETWDAHHAGRTVKQMDNGTKADMNSGGHGHFGMTDEIMESAKPHNKHFALHAHTGREGFIGWAGFGGSVFMWNPELEIGFGYVPFNFITGDMNNKRGATIQAVVLQIVKGTYVERPTDVGSSTCTVF